MNGTLNGRLLPSGEVVYGCTCNVSISLAAVSIEFDTDFTIASFEDLDWCFRAIKQGVPVSYQPQAVVEHCFLRGPCAVFRQFQRYGAFQDLMVQKHSRFLGMMHQSRRIPANRKAARGIISDIQSIACTVQAEHDSIQCL